MGLRGKKVGSPPNAGGGRPKGSKNKHNVLSLAAVAKILKDKKTPLDFMLAVMESECMPSNMRMEAARAAAPYIHKKMPTAIEMAGGLELTHRGGVMVVPAPQSNADWEKRSKEAQSSLKEDVKK